MAQKAAERLKTELEIRTRQAGEAIAAARSGASKAKQSLREINKEIEELRQAPFVDAGVRVFVAAGTGSALAIADEAMGPLFEFMPDEDANGVAIEGTGYTIGMAVPGAVVLTVLGITEKSQTLLDAGAAATAIAAHQLTSQFYQKSFRSA